MLLFSFPLKKNKSLNFDSHHWISTFNTFLMVLLACNWIMKFPKLRKRTVYWAVLTVFALFTIHFVFQYKEHNSHRVQPIVLIPKAFPSLILNSFDTQNEELVPIKLLKNCQIIRSYHTGYEENTKLLGQEPQSNFHKFISQCSAQWSQSDLISNNVNY